MISEEKLTEVMRISGEIFRRNARKRNPGFTIGEGPVLAFLNENGRVTAGDLVDHAHVGTGRISNILKTLEIKGLILRVKSKEDRRITYVILTERGRERIIEQQRKMRERLRLMLDYLGEEDTDHLMRILHKISDFKEEGIC